MAEPGAEPAQDEQPARRRGPRRREADAPAGTERRNGDRRSTPGLIGLLRALFGRKHT
jgi:hypothetical protein